MAYPVKFISIFERHVTRAKPRLLFSRLLQTDLGLLLI